jgi:heme A synthase
MNSHPGRLALIIFGAIALIAGAIFAGQGANIIPGSSMTGDRKWLYIGVIVAVVGIILIVLGARRPRRGNADR